MINRSLHVLVDQGTFYEGPRWHDGRWWVSDFYSHTVFAVSPDGRREAIMTVEGQPSGTGWHPDGTLLVVSMNDRRLLRRTPDGSVELFAELGPLGRGPLNDMVVDQHGRAWIGSFGFDLMNGEPAAPANLVRVDPEGTVEVVAEEMQFPNGSVVSCDGETLIVAESGAGRFTAFTIAGDGSLTDRRVWAQPSNPSIAPDGCCLDSECHIWAADPIGNRCVRITEGGPVVNEIKMPEGLTPFACMLGGEDGCTLLVCAAPGFAEHERRVANDAILLTALVEVPHAGLP